MNEMIDLTVNGSGKRWYQITSMKTFELNSLLSHNIIDQISLSNCTETFYQMPKDHFLFRSNSKQNDSIGNIESTWLSILNQKKWATWLQHWIYSVCILFIHQQLRYLINFRKNLFFSWELLNRKRCWIESEINLCFIQHELESIKYSL